MTPEQLYRVARGGNDAVNRLRLVAGAQALARWRQLGNVDEAAARAFVAAVVPVVESVQATSVAATRAYLAAAIGETVEVDIGAALTARGVPAVEVYRRPVIVARTALAEGLPWAQAMRLAGERVVQLAETDVALAARSAATQTMRASSRVVGYRRVTDGQACPLCSLAATQRYHIEQLMPIHGRCGCTVAPIVGDVDPGRIIDAAAHERLKAQGVIDARTEQRRGARELAAERTAVHEHGELGPVLSDAGHDFTGPAGLAA